MTLHELYENALRRHPKMRDGRFARSNFKRWLDDRIADGWLEKRGTRYYLTPAGRQIACALADELTIGDRLAA